MTEIEVNGYQGDPWAEPSGDWRQFKVRVKDSMRAEIEASAKQRGVSMNSEMVRRLAASASQETLRDKFALAVLPALVDQSASRSDWARLPAFAYEIADQMLAAREG